MERRLITGVTLAFVALLAFLTLFAAVKNGVSFLTVVSVVVVALLAIGLIGALASMPPDD
jgi:hypothetical protein